MSEFEPDPSASTGRFRAFVERGEEDAPVRRRSGVSPVVWIIGVVVLIAIVVVILGLA
jgi:hypothetical protein